MPSTVKVVGPDSRWKPKKTAMRPLLPTGRPPFRALTGLFAGYAPNWMNQYYPASHLFLPHRQLPGKPGAPIPPRPALAFLSKSITMPQTPELRMQQFSPWIAGFPGLIWSIDIPHSRLKVFNRWSIPGLDVPRLLKDARYRKKAVRREDHALLMEFWDMLTARRPGRRHLPADERQRDVHPARLARRKRLALLRVPQGSLPPGGVFGGPGGPGPARWTSAASAIPSSRSTSPRAGC